MQNVALVAFCKKTTKGESIMTQFLQTAKHFVTSEDGPTAVEYAVVLALIIVAAMGAIGFLGGQLETWFTNSAGDINTEITGS